MRTVEVKTQPDTMVDPDVIEVVVKALQRAEEPLLASKIKSGLSGPAAKLKPNHFQALLEELVSEGRAYRFEPTTKSGKPKYWSKSFEQIKAEIANTAPETLDDCEEPITAKDFKRKLVGAGLLTEDRLQKILDKLVDEGRVYRFEPTTKKGKPKYWSQSPEQLAGELIIKALETGEKNRTALNKSLKGFQAKLVDQRLQRLVEEQRVYAWPPVGSSKALTYALQPPDPLAYLREPVEKVVRQLSEAGVTRERMLDAVAEILGVPVKQPAPVSTSSDSKPDLERRIINQMIAIQPAAATGSLVSIRDLRRSLASEVPEKETFDLAVWRLAEQGKVALHRHDYPAGLNEQERAEMVTDGQGNYFIGIALRREG